MLILKISAILDFRHPIIGSLKIQCRTSYRPPIDTIALNCLVLRKSHFYVRILAIETDGQTDKQTDRQTNGQTDRQTDSPNALSLINVVFAQAAYFIM